MTSGGVAGAKGSARAVADVADCRRILDLLVDRIRSLPLTRLERAAEGHESTRAAAVHACAQALADLAADGEGQPRRELPRLATHGLGDQLAVVGHDALRVAPGVVAAVRDELLSLRRSL